MTTQIFIYNATGVTFQLFDGDANFFANLGQGGFNSLKLNYSSTFQKKYVLKQFGTNNTVPFWLDINGELLRVGTGVVILEIGSEFRPNVTDKLTLLPGPTLPLAPPQCFPFNSPALIYYNDY